MKGYKKKTRRASLDTKRSLMGFFSAKKIANWEEPKE
jgi:hypothetical protein